MAAAAGARPVRDGPRLLRCGGVGVGAAGVIFGGGAGRVAVFFAGAVKAAAGCRGARTWTMRCEVSFQSVPGAH